MIELTVKTLDSQNHTYSVPDEISVKQFKDKIANSVGITADKQRLIYCGRVLQDEKKLSDYDVNGKVIHLVQRPPPGANRPSTGTSSQPGNTQSTTNRSSQQRSGPHDGNSFLLGAFTVPSDVMDANHVHQIVQQVVTGMGELGRNATVMSRASDDGSTVDVHINLSQSAVRSETNQRILSAQSMIRRAGECITRLQNRSEAQAPDEGDETPTAETAADGQAGFESDEVQIDLGDAASFLRQMDPGAGAGGMTATGITDAARVAAAAVFAAASAAANAPPGASATEQPAGPVPERESTPTAGQASNGTGSGTDGNNARNANNSRSQAPTPPPASALAGVLDDVAAFHARFLPHLDRLRTIVREDSDYEGRPDERTADQNTFANVSRILHFLSHAYHVISDVVLDLSQPPPRTLHSRILMVQQPTAIVQAGIPVQAQISINTSLNATRPTTTSSNSGSGASATTTSSTSTSSSTSSSANPAANAAQNPMAGLFGGQNPFVFMEVGPGSITIDSISAAVVTEANGIPTAMGPGSRFPSVVLPQGQTQDFLQNLMQAVGHGTAPQRAATNGQSQARGNTATQPTTSTQTRSTSRPIQTIPMPFPGFALPSFDPFLPCTSRHMYSCLRHRPLAAQLVVGNPSQQQQGGGGGGNTINNQFAGLVANMMSSLLGGQAPTVPPQTTNESASSNSTSNQRPAAESASNPQILRTFFRDLGLSSESGPSRSMTSSSSLSLFDFLRSLPGYTHMNAEGFVNELLMCVASHLTLQEFVEIFTGRTEPLDGLRPHLEHFIRSQLPSGNDDETSVRNTTTRFAGDLVSSLVDVVGSVTIRDGVDYAATMRRFWEFYLHTLTMLIMPPDRDDFGRCFSNGCRGILSLFIRLNIYCLGEGADALERVVQSAVRRMSADLSPQVQTWMAETSVTQLREMIETWTVSERSVRTYVVHTTDAPRAADLDESAAQREGRGTVIRRTSEEEMEVIAGAPEVIVPEPISIVRPVTPPPPVASDAMDAEEDDSVAMSEAMWHGAVPADWVPIIADDVQRQRRTLPQRPFSDAYIASMPSKRRKVMAETRLQVATDVATLLPDALRRAVAATGVQPTTSMDAVARDLDSNARLQTALTDHLHGSIRRRLAEDVDYDPEKFPSTDALFRNVRKGKDF